MSDRFTSRGELSEGLPVGSDTSLESAMRFLALDYSNNRNIAQALETSFPDLHSRVESLESVIFSSRNSGTQEVLYSAWCNTVVELVNGEDDCTDPYKSRLQPYIDRVNTRVCRSEAEVLLDMLSHAVNSQKSLAYHIEECIEANHRLSQDTHLFRGATCTLLDSFTNPHELLMFFATQGGSEDVEKASKDLNMKNVDQIKKLHEEYHALPRQLKREFIGNLLGSNTGPGKFRRNNSQLVDELLVKFLPEDKCPHSNEPTGAHQIGKVIGKFALVVGTTSDSVASIAALITALNEDARAPKSINKDERFGFRLASYLKELGPGTNKVGQYGDSLPITPDEWRKGLRTTKYAGDTITRAQFWRIAETVLPSDLINNLRLNDQCGVGSYLITYGITLSDQYRESNDAYSGLSRDEDLVLSILKENAEHDAVHFVTLLIAIAEEIAKMSPAAFRSVAPLQPLFEQGLKMVQRETDLRISKQQEEIISQVYESLTILVNQQPIQHHTAGAFECERQYRISRRIEGVSFNSLEVGSEEKRIYAVSALASEAFVWLTGRKACHDRHGDNFNCKSSIIGHFDPGARALEAPTDKQLVDMVDVLLHAAFNSLRNRYGFLSSLKHTLQKVEQRNELGQEVVDPSYLLESQRMLLSWGDMVAAIKAGDGLAIGLAILRTGKVHPKVLATVLSRIVSRGLGILGMKSKREQEREACYYPDNPNPYQKQKGGDESKREKNVPVVVPLRVEIKDSNVKSSFIGFSIAAIVQTAEFFSSVLSRFRRK